MTRDEIRVDYAGARGSNTGDEYHELWAVRHTLRLLDEHSNLSAMTVEGLRSQDGTGPVWEGVDCALFYGGDTSETAEQVELQQLKYSGANPEAAWTVARFATGRNGRTTSSPIRKLANAYRGIVAKRSSRSSDSVRIAFVTNQPIDEALVSLIESARVAVPASYRTAWRPGAPALHRLVHASGLRPTIFKAFAQALDLKAQSGSRFAAEEALLKAVSEWSDTEFREATRRLREYVRQRMLPEAAGDPITREKVLVQFGVADDQALFPCPSLLKQSEHAVPRAAAKQVAETMIAGRQRVCLHGGGGTGKTTALQEIGALLPSGSLMVTFDCYGGGSYLDASALRHRPEDAFLQLSNEIARQLRVPLLLETRGSRNFARAFRKRLTGAAALLSQTQPNAVLLVAIDAADNSITAAQQRSPPEKTFVHELVSFTEFPQNVRLLVTARSGRRNELSLSHEFEQIELPPFTNAETAANVARYWNAPDDWVDDFHHLSNGIPRVQGYAFENAGQTPARAIDALRPLGKKLDQVFKERFGLALTKIGRAPELQRVCAGLVALARPIPIGELSAILQFDEAQVADVCADLAPGVRNEAGYLSFADEDFEAFVRDAAKDALADVQERIAKRFLSRALTDPYAAFNLAPALFAAKRAEELLDFVERVPEPAPELIPDPVRRREVQLKRLLIAIRVCRKAGNTARALRFVLIGAEAIRTDAATRSLLTSFPELTARYTKDTASRLILGDPDRLKDHGPLLAQLLAEDAAKGDAIAVREGWRRLQAWFEAREDALRKARQENEHADAWEISEREGAAVLYATLLQDGLRRTTARLKHFRPWGFALASARGLVARLLSERRFRTAQALVCTLPDAWSVFLLVPLAIAEQTIDYERLERGLRALKRRFKLDGEVFGYSTFDDALGSYVIDTVLSGIEILTAKAVGPHTVQSLIAPFLDEQFRRVDRRYDFQINHLDAILRCFCLREALAGRDIKAEEILTPRPPPEMSDKQGTRPTDGREHDEQIRELIAAVTPFYGLRAQSFVAASAAPLEERFADVQRRFTDGARKFDRRRGSSSFRAKIAEGLSVLVAAGVDPRVVLQSALVVRSDAWSGGESGIGRLVIRLAAIPALDSNLLTELTRVVSDVRRSRTGAQDKSRTLAEFARLLVPISSADADLVFKLAIDVASELDSEAMDQLRLSATLIARALPALSGRENLARSFAEVVRDAGVRLQDVEHFPWEESFGGLATLDFPTGLAAAARWDDSGTVDLDKSLAPTVTVGVETAAITAAQALAMLGMLERASDIQLRAVLLSGDHAQLAAEELAHDVLCDRISSSKEVAAFIERHGAASWTKLFLAQREFENSLPADLDPKPDAHSVIKEEGRSLLDSYVWSEAVVLDVERLGEAVEELLRRARGAGEFVSIGDVLQHSRSNVGVGLRVQHLDALAGLVDRLSTRQVLQAIVDASRDWREQLSVVNWCKTRLPYLIAMNLPSFAPYPPWDTGPLDNVLQLAQATDAQIQSIVLEGIERNADGLGAGATFALAGMAVARLQPMEAAALCEWYIQRLVARVESDDLESVPAKDLPRDAREAVARFLLAYLSDVDVRQRWRAAHALRRLARLGETSTLDLIVHQIDRHSEGAFRQSNAPFYWIAAKLWLVIGLGRIASETPNAATRHGNWLLGIALSDEFPHLLIRDYAADACRALVENGQLTLSPQQAAQLDNVNCSALPRGSKKREYGRSFDRPGHCMDQEKRRFRFDALDTLRYWYEPWLRAFEDLTPDHFIEVAERWIVDVWNVIDEKPDGLKESRKGRFNERDWTLAYASHGSMPTMERHRTYLEWHAMWCAAGEILKTHCLAKPEYDGDDELRERISYNKPSVPGIWLADLVGPLPLELPRWQPPPSGPEWFAEVSDERFQRELLPAARPGYVVAEAYIYSTWGGRRETVRVHSALVSPETASALLRALQTVEDSFDYYLCPEGDDREINDPEYTLVGWLAHRDGGPESDSKDVYRNGVRRLENEPGDRVAKRFVLARRFEPGCVTWTCDDEQTPCFIYEAWGGREKDDRRGYYGSDDGSRGQRLLVRADFLSKFLSAEGLDLIAEVGVSRRAEKSRSYSDDEEGAQDVEFDRVFLLRADGGFEVAEQSVGTWYQNRARAGAGA